MSEYRIRNGIVLESICGRYVLISTEAARDECDYIRLIDPMVAFYWEMMENGLSVDEMAEKAAELFPDINRETVRNDIDDLITQLKDFGYLLKDDE